MQQKAMSREISIPRPQDHHFFVGHTAAIDMLEQAAQAQQLPHAWLLTGPRGIGKATLAYRFARMALSGASTMAVESNSSVGRKVSQASHPDMLVLEREINEKTLKQDAEIKIDTVRKVGEFLAYTATTSPYRVILVDSVDDLNINAANALLKNLEEPPPFTIFLMLNHRPDSVLPTIASRCIQVRMHRLDAAQVQQVLAHTLPELSDAERQTLAVYAGGCPGIATTLHVLAWENWLETLVLLLQAGPSLPMNKVYQWIDSILVRQSDDVFVNSLYVLYIVLSRLVKQSFGEGNQVAVTSGEAALWKNPHWINKVEALLPVIQQLGKLVSDRKLVHAEKRTTMLGVFEQLRSV
jgi:DNA polymerase III subunit delta'